MTKYLSSETASKSHHLQNQSVGTATDAQGMQKWAAGVGRKGGSNCSTTAHYNEADLYEPPISRECCSQCYGYLALMGRAEFTLSQFNVGNETPAINHTCGLGAGCNSNTAPSEHSSATVPLKILMPPGHLKGKAANI
ncbi:hypothetical protein BaRGS_00017402 [Batillaria attramentaria]|uniref:Uncharacterized protein n=1 Tax=Batillaria attramentaria TaxID=370345 RepID=A0ABD0KW97_9CAEN